MRENNIHVRAIYYFDEPIRGPNGSVMTARNLANMSQVVKEVWPSKPTMAMFHRWGNAPLPWTSETFDQIPQNYVGYCDWVGVDPTHTRGITPPFFEWYNHMQYEYIVPDNATIQTYYDAANSQGAKALLWFWYPDSYASSFDEDPMVQPLNNVWAKEKEIWLAADLGWK